MPVVVLGLLATLVGGFTVLVPVAPTDQSNVCRIFQSQPQWYDYARASEQRWGTPIAIQMAFVHYESSFRSHVRPPRTRLFGIIPWVRPSSAYGYAQAQDPAWQDYLDATGDGLFVQRTRLQHALDFIGWYNHLSHDQLGIDLDDARRLYLAYHEGRTGFLERSYLNKPAVSSLAKRVAARAARYDQQLAECESKLRCRHFYQFRPFCD